MSTILRLVNSLKPKKKKTDENRLFSTVKDEKEALKQKVPALAMPNTNSGNLMDQLEGLMPQWKEEKEKRPAKSSRRNRSQSRSRSRERKKRRERSRGK